MKRILHISFMILLPAGTLFLLSFADMKHRVQRFKSFRIEVLNPSDDALVNESEIRHMVTSKFGSIEGSMTSMIDLNDLETYARNNPYISSCEVYRTIAGELFMKARVRSPLVRVMNESGQQYFIDKLGFMVPVNLNHPSHVIVASGNITERLFSTDKSERPISSLPDSSVIRQIYAVALLIAADEFLSSFIDQIYISESREMELVPKIGSQEILLGTSENAEQKLENLRTFYLNIMNRLDWNTYKVINLKYNKQVVCLK